MSTFASERGSCTPPAVQRRLLWSDAPYCLCLPYSEACCACWLGARPLLWTSLLLLPQPLLRIPLPLLLPSTAMPLLLMLLPLLLPLMPLLPP